MRNGPTKIILINAGKFDYAEVALDGAIQIVGDNNWGKTTLINTLQFLYFDEKTKFGLGSYSPDETLDYYFASEYSYVLFECRTLRGNAVIGWRGASKVSGGDPERFIYFGPYRREDFFDDENRIRKPKEIVAALGTDRHFQLIPKAADYRSILLSGSSQRGDGLGIIALNGDRFSDFRETFRNLLNLANIRQDEMRDRLLMLAGLPTDYVAIDVRRISQGDYEQMRREAEDLKQFQTHQNDVKELIHLFKERQILWGQLNYRFEDLKTRKKAFNEEHKVKAEKTDEQFRKVLEQAKEAKDKQDAKRKEKEGFIASKSPIELSLQKLTENKNHFSGFVEQLEEGALNQLNLELLELSQLQQQASMETPEAVAKQLEAAERKACLTKQSIAQFSQLMVTELRRYFSDSEISHIFQVFNPDLLGLHVGPGGISTTSPKQVIERMRQLLARIQDGVYQDEILTVRLNVSGEVLSKFENVEALEKQLKREERIVQDYIKLLEAVTQRDQLSKKVKEKTELQQKLSAELAAFRQHQKDLLQESQWLEATRKFSNLITASQTRIEELEQELETCRTRKSNLEKLKELADEEYQQVLKRYEECQAKIAIFNVAPLADADIPDSFDGAVSLYLREFKRQADLSRDLDTSFARLGVFVDQYRSDRDGETIRNLEQQLDALPKREEALQLRWRNFIQSLKSRFQQVLNDLRLVESAKDRLNRELGRVKISDLKAVKLTVELQNEETSLIQRLANINELDLSNDMMPVEKVFERVRGKLGSKPVTRIAELFTLGVSVIRADGTTRRHPDIHQVESDGTTVTIKVLFNLLVLKSLLHKDNCAVPFFLDEIQMLDAANQRAIIQTAKDLGFIAITAAPSAVGEVDGCYFLEPDSSGRVVCTDLQRLTLEVKEPSVSNEH